MSRNISPSVKLTGALSAAAILLSGMAIGAEEKKSKHEDLTFDLIAGETKHEHKVSKQGKKYQGNAEAIKAGAEHYHKFNCVGCHFDGGGGIGPALIDDIWVYGSSIDHIAASIRQGRPNGMPSFRSILSEEQIWQLAAYVEDGLKEHPHGHGGEGHAQGDEGKGSKDDAKTLKEEAAGEMKGKEHKHSEDGSQKTGEESKGSKEGAAAPDSGGGHEHHH